jgi:hypothetical protein
LLINHIPFAFMVDTSLLSSKWVIGFLLSFDHVVLYLL